MSTTPAKRDDYMTTAEVAATLRVAESTVRYWRMKEVGPIPFKIGKNAYLYVRSEVDQYKQAREGKKAS